MTTTSRVIVAGDVIDDVIAVVQDEIRINTDTPAQIKRTLGGSAANTAVWLAQQECAVDFFGRVGLGDVARCQWEFSAAGVTAHLAGDHNLETGTIVIIAHGEDRSMLSDRGANVAFEPEVIDEEVLDSASWLHLTGYGFFHHTRPAAVSDLLTRARSRGLGVMVDASSTRFLSDMDPEVFLGLVSQATVLRCNEEEAHLLSGENTAERALQSLGERFDRVIVTQGPRGSLVWEDGAPHHVTAMAVAKILDPTGAGDAFNAGILAGLSRGLSILDSTPLAAQLAAECVTRLGARP